MASPTLKFNNGSEMPVVGLGTWAAAPGEVTRAVIDAIEAGYRHFDCAYLYGNEEEVGKGFKAKIDDGTVKREDLFITSKLWNNAHPRDMVVPMCKASLKNLGLDYLDLYLIHWPFAWKEGDDLWPMKNGRMLFSNVDYLETWQGMEECVNLKLTKSIGVSNFNSEQIERLLANAKIKPVNNQVEANIYLNQNELNEFCRQRNITLTAYCPLGRPSKFHSPHLEDTTIRKLSAKYGKTPAQVILKYLIAKGMSVIPKSTNKKRIQENIDLFDFNLDNEDIAEIDKLNKGCRVCWLDDNKTHPHYPFNIKF